jgi:hypothetical protein
VDYSKFKFVITIFSDDVGNAWTIWGGGENGAIFPINLATASYICHEMGHCFGYLNNTMIDDSFDLSERILETYPTWHTAPGQYYNQTDIMSHGNSWSTSHSQLSECGPNICINSKYLLGWIDNQNEKHFNTDQLNKRSFYERVTLVSRSHPEIKGFQSIRLNNGYTIEFATEEGWDSGLGNSGILINERKNKTPYIHVKDSKNNPDDKFWNKDELMFYTTYSYPLSPGSPHSKSGVQDIYVQIIEIDLINKTAQIDITTNPTYPKYQPPMNADIEIKAVNKFRRKSDGIDYIVEVGVLDSSGKVNGISREDVVDLIKSRINTFYVLSRSGKRADVIVNHHFITTEPDNELDNNLLSLPQF